jgi:hypothetical protein
LTFQILTSTINSVVAPLESVDQTRSHIKTLLDQPEADKFAILLYPDSQESTETPKVIGLVGTKSTPELTYTIHSKYANKGYMTAALTAFVGAEGYYWDLPSASASKSNTAPFQHTNSDTRALLIKHRP